MRFLQPEQIFLNHLVSVLWSTLPSPFVQQMFLVASRVLLPQFEIVKHKFLILDYVACLSVEISNLTWSEAMCNMSALNLSWYYQSKRVPSKALVIWCNILQIVLCLNIVKLLTHFHNRWLKSLNCCCCCYYLLLTDPF